MKFRAAFALAGAVLLSACGLNSVPTAEENAKARWADVQTNYQRRADLIPNLVATVKGAAGSEGKILNDVVSARARASQIQVSGDDLTDPAKVSAFNQAQNGLSLSLQRLQEAYPQLQSQGIQVDQWMAATGQDAASLTESFKEQSAKAVKVDLALRAVAVSETLEVEPANFVGSLVLASGFFRNVGKTFATLTENFARYGRGEAAGAAGRCREFSV